MSPQPIHSAPSSPINPKTHEDEASESDSDSDIDIDSFFSKEDRQKEKEKKKKKKRENNVDAADSEKTKNENSNTKIDKETQPTVSFKLPLSIESSTTAATDATANTTQNPKKSRLAELMALAAAEKERKHENKDNGNNLDNDSDDDDDDDDIELEIIPDSAYDKVPKALRTMAALAGKNLHTTPVFIKKEKCDEYTVDQCKNKNNKSGALPRSTPVSRVNTNNSSGGDLISKLLQRQRQQLISERVEKMELLKSYDIGKKGALPDRERLELERAEREIEQEQLLSKAKKSAAWIRKREQEREAEQERLKLKRQSGKVDDEDDDENDEDYDDEEREIAIDVPDSDEEDKNDKLSDSEFIEKEVEEDSDEEDEEDEEVNDDNSETDGEQGEEEGSLKGDGDKPSTLKKRSRLRAVVADDDDEEETSTQFDSAPTQMITGNPSQPQPVVDSQSSDFFVANTQPTLSQTQAIVDNGIDATQPTFTKTQVISGRNMDSITSIPGTQEEKEEEELQNDGRSQSFLMHPPQSQSRQQPFTSHLKKSVGFANQSSQDPNGNNDEDEFLTPTQLSQIPAPTPLSPPRRFKTLQELEEEEDELEGEDDEETNLKRGAIVPAAFRRLQKRRSHYLGDNDNEDKNSDATQVIVPDSTLADDSDNRKEIESTRPIKDNNQTQLINMFTGVPDASIETKGNEGKMEVVKEKKSKKDKRERRQKSALAAEILDQEAVESEDEWAGLGGASDDDDENDENSEEAKELIKTLINDNDEVLAQQGGQERMAQNNMSYFMEKQKEADDAATKELMEMTAGGWRKRSGRNGRGMFGDVSDEEDNDYDEFMDEDSRRALQLRRIKKRQEAMRLKLEENKNSSYLINDHKANAFVREIFDITAGNIGGGDAETRAIFGDDPGKTEDRNSGGEDDDDEGNRDTGSSSSSANRSESHTPQDRNTPETGDIQGNQQESENNNNTTSINQKRKSPPANGDESLLDDEDEEADGGADDSDVKKNKKRKVDLENIRRQLSFLDAPRYGMDSDVIEGEKEGLLGHKDSDEVNDEEDDEYFDAFSDDDLSNSNSGTDTQSLSQSRNGTPLETIAENTNHNKNLNEGNEVDDDDDDNDLWEAPTSTDLTATSTTTSSLARKGNNITKLTTTSSTRASLTTTAAAGTGDEDTRFFGRLLSSRSVVSSFRMTSSASRKSSSSSLFSESSGSTKNKNKKTTPGSKEDSPAPSSIFSDSGNDTTTSTRQVVNVTIGLPTELAASSSSKSRASINYKKRSAVVGGGSPIGLSRKSLSGNNSGSASGMILKKHPSNNKNGRLNQSSAAGSSLDKKVLERLVSSHQRLSSFKGSWS